MSPIKVFEDNVQESFLPRQSHKTTEKQTKHSDVVKRTPLSSRLNKNIEMFQYDTMQIKTDIFSGEISRSKESFIRKKVCFSETEATRNEGYNSKIPTNDKSKDTLKDTQKIQTKTSPSPNPVAATTPNSKGLPGRTSLRSSLRATMKSPRSESTMKEGCHSEKTPEEGLPEIACHGNLKLPKIDINVKDRDKVDAVNSNFLQTTPKSILKEEMDDDVEVSLLFSPQPASDVNVKSNETNLKQKSPAKSVTSLTPKMRKNFKSEIPKPRSRLEKIAIAAKMRNLSDRPLKAISCTSTPDNISTNQRSKTAHRSKISTSGELMQKDHHQATDPEEDIFKVQRTDLNALPENANKPSSIKGKDFDFSLSTAPSTGILEKIDLNQLEMANQNSSKSEYIQMEVQTVAFDDSRFRQSSTSHGSFASVQRKRDINLAKGAKADISKIQKLNIDTLACNNQQNKSPSLTKTISPNSHLTATSSAIQVEINSTRPEFTKQTKSKSDFTTLVPKIDSDDRTLRKPLATFGNCASAVRNGDHWYSALPASILNTKKSTIDPITSKGNGICMDLTDIFIDAATKRTPSHFVSKTSSEQCLPKPDLESNLKKSHQWEKRTISVTHSVESDDWSEKQCHSFTQWLNYTFEPTEEMDVDETDLSLDRVALRSLVVHRRMANARSAAMSVYKGSEMTKTRKAIALEIHKKRISIRKDRNLHADLTIRNQVMTLLFSYSIPWLRLGLETLYGESIAPYDHSKRILVQNSTMKASNKPPTSRMKLALRQFIASRLLSDDKILAKYTKGKCLVPSGNFEKKYNMELNTFVLNRLLVLVLFLDIAKRNNILEKVPNLFQKDADVKSTRGVLLALCRDFLQAEGDFVKHLVRLGLEVVYKQEPLDELEFLVKNLAVDLRDGTRLVNLAEIISGCEPKSLLKQLRLPGGSRLQKLHNVGVALKEFMLLGVPITTDVAAHHIVDGHRQIVLKLLWTIVAHCCLMNLLNLEKVELEIDRIGFNSHQRREAMIKDDFDDVDKLKDVLLRWCHAICSRVGMPVRNFTTDFANGRAVCHIINYYHPTLLLIDEISKPCDKASMENNADAYEIQCANERSNAILANKRMSELGGIPQMVPMCDSSNAPDEKAMLFCLTFLCSRLMESRIEIRSCLIIQRWLRQKFNKKLARKKASAARIILRAWRTNKKNYYQVQAKKYLLPVQIIEKFLIHHWLSLSLLRGRRIAKESLFHASSRIQKIFRQFICRQKFKRLVCFHVAARKVQAAWRCHFARQQYKSMITREKAAAKIQTFLKTATKNNNIRLYHHYECAKQIQRIWRGFWCQLCFQIDKFDVVTVQSCSRRWIAKSKLDKGLFAIHMIQRSVRIFLHQRNLLRNRASVTLQCFARQNCALAIVKRERVILKYISQTQNFWRQVLAKRSKNALMLQRARMHAAMCIQRYWRRHIALLVLRKLQLSKRRVHGAIAIQGFCRIAKAKRVCNEMRELQAFRVATITVQCFLRRSLARARFHELQQCCERFQSALSIQSIWRRVRSRTRVERLLAAVKILQFSNELSQLHERSVTLLQRTWRRKLAYMLVQIRHSGIIKIQSVTRMHRTRSLLKWTNSRITMVQAMWRCIRQREKFKAFVVSLIVCQSACRAFCAKREHNRMTAALQLVQCFSRRILAKLMLKKLRYIARERKQSALYLQKSWRKWSASSLYRQTKVSTIVLQSLLRLLQAKRKAQKQLLFIVTMQSSIRVFLARKHLQRVLSEKMAREKAERNAASRIQSVVRGAIVRTEHRHLDNSATSIQRIFRGFLCKADFRLTVLDAIMIQIIVRQWIARRIREKRMNAKVFLQSFARGTLARIRATRISSVKTIQRTYRGHVGRSLAIKHISARKIQKTWRCYDTHCNFMISCLVIIKVQSLVRRWLCKRRSSQKYDAVLTIQAYSRMKLSKNLRSRRYTSVCTIQAFCRMSILRVFFFRLRNEHRSAISLQSFVRMVLCHEQYALERFAARSVQRIVRGFLTRIDIREKHRTATQIQKIWRGYLGYTTYACQVLSALKLQCFFRTIKCKLQLKNLRDDFKCFEFLQRHSAFKIQIAYRHYRDRIEVFRAASTIQRAATNYLLKTAFSRLRRGIIRCQALVRAQKIRSRRSKKMLSQVARLNLAYNKAKEDPKLKLDHRTRVALDVLLCSRSLSEIMHAICLLELATRYSEACCIAFTKAGAADILFPIIRSCNRSLPHLEILHFVLLTLSNVAKFNSLLPSITSIAAAEVFLDLVQMFRDKDAIFPLASMLLERIVVTSDEVKVHCASRENRKRLKGIVQLVIRKLSLAGVDLAPEVGVSSRTRSVSKNNSCRKRSSTIKCQERRDAYSDPRSGLCSLQRILRMFSPE